MDTNNNEYQVIIHTTPEKKSKLNRMKNYLSKKVTQLLYNIRKQASRVVINGRRIVANPDDIPVELKTASVKQLGKIQKTLSALNVQEEIVETAEETKVEVTTEMSATNIELVSENNDVVEVRPSLGPEPDPGPASIVAGGSVADKISSTNISAAASKTSTTTVIDATEYEEVCGDGGEVEAGRVEISSPEDDGIEEIPFETKREMRKNRPKAAVGERYTTVIPPYIIIDENSEIPSSPRKKKRPNAAKGKRKVMEESIDLIDLPVDTLIERFRDPYTEPIRTRNRPQAARGRVQSRMEDLVDLPGVVPSPKIDRKPVQMEMVEDDTDSLDELLADLGIIPARKRKDKPDVKARHIVIDDEDDDKDAMDDDDDDDEAMFGLPYLPKSQRVANFGDDLPWLWY